MEECNDNRSMESTDSKTTPSSKLRPKKRSLVERELETSLTSKITSPILNSETINTSRYGRARRLKNDNDRKIESPLPILSTQQSPTRGLSAYKMYASNSPTNPQSIKHGFDNQIENIYNQNIALSRFNSDEKMENMSKSKTYMRKDLIQTRDKEETIILIKNMFSPNKNVSKPEVTLSSEKSTKNHKRDLSSVVKTLDFDGKKKKDGQEKRMPLSDLFELEAQCEYQVGDLAWARMGSYPFWPSIVTREPSSNLFIKKKLFGKLEKDIIHVTFLGDNGRRGWILVSMLRKYLGRQEFETTRENFTSEAKRKDYRLYAAFFVTGKRLPLWHLSVEEADILCKEPKRLRIDILNSMLSKGKEHKAIPTKSKKVTRTDSDISLSESLYDSLFSEEDYRGSETEPGRSKTRKKSFDVSEVVTACLDNMAAKTGITKIQKQSHMDIWLQKAKSKTPEKCPFKQSKSEQKVKVISKSCNDSNASMEYKQNHEREHDYFTRSTNTNGHFDDEIVSGIDFKDPNITSKLSNNEEPDVANELCINICKKDVLGISPDILDENFTEIEIITNEDMIVDQCDINELILKVDQINHVDELHNSKNPHGNNKPKLEQSNVSSKFTLINAINNKKDHLMEKCLNIISIDQHKVDDNTNCHHTTNNIKVNKALLELISNISSSKNNFVSNNNMELFSNNVSGEKSLIVSDSNESDSNLSELKSNGTNNIKSDSTKSKSDIDVQDKDICKDYKTELKSLVIDKDIITNDNTNIKKINETLKKEVESTDETAIDAKQCTTSENNKLNEDIEKIKAIKNSTEKDRVTESLHEVVTDIQWASTVGAKLHSSDNGEVVHENIETVIFAPTNIPKICEDVTLPFEKESNTIPDHFGIKIAKNIEILKDDNKSNTLSLRDDKNEDSSDFVLTYNLDNECNSDSTNDLDCITSTTSEKNSCELNKEILAFAEPQSNKLHNKVSDIYQSKLCNSIWAKNNKSENNCKDIVDVIKSNGTKDTKDHFSRQENILKNEEFLKYVEQKQDIIMDENPNLTYEEVTAYLLKTWQYEQSLKSDKKVSNVIELGTTDNNDHDPLESKKKSKTRGRRDEYLQTSIDFKELQNKPKTDNENSNSPNVLSDKRYLEQCDNSMKREVSVSLSLNNVNNGDLLPLNDIKIGVNEQSYKEQNILISNTSFNQKNAKKDEIKNSNELEIESSYNKRTEINTDETQIRKQITPISYKDLTLESETENNSKKCIKQNVSSENHASGEYFDNKCKENNSNDVLLWKDTPISEEENIEICTSPEYKNMTSVNDFSHSSGIVGMFNHDTEISLIESEKNYSAHSGLKESAKQNDNKVSKNRLSLRLKRNVLMSDTESDSAKSQIGNVNKMLTNEDNGILKACEKSSTTMPNNEPVPTYSCKRDSSPKLPSCKDYAEIKSDNTLNKSRLSSSPPLEGVTRKKQSKIDDFIKRTKDLNLSFNSSNDNHLKTACSEIPTTQDSCNINNISRVTPNLEDNDITLSKRQLRKETQPSKSTDLENPEFLEYLELRQDQLMDEHPELTLEEIATYLYNTWFFEESIKSDNKRTDDLEQRSLVKGLSQDIVSVKNVRKKGGVDKEKDFMPKMEVPIKEKSKRRAERQFYREDFSDLEDDLDVFQVFNSTSQENTKDEEGTSKINVNTNKEGLPRDYETAYVVNDSTMAEEDMAENFDQVEEYFRKLTEPKPNLFKGLIREKLCQVCERTGDLIKCKGCHNFFHANCSRKGVEIKESPNPVRGRKKKRKNRGRKPRCLDDSFEDHSDKSQEHDMSFEHETESHTIANADEFEEKLSEKLKEIIENPDLKYDTNSSEEELDWSDTEIGSCKIVDIIPKKKKQEAIDFKCTDCEENSIPICFVCKRAISAKKQIAHRQKCQVPHCNKYYHIECLEHWPQTQLTTGEKKSKEFVESLQCPRHVCHTCVCDDPRGCKTRFSGDKLARCVRCPATYHTFTKCLPAGTQILSGSHIICPRHYEHRPGKVPCHVNTGWCFICALGGTLICCEYCPTSFHAECLNIEPPEGGYMCEDCETGCLPLYGEMVWVKLGHYRWWPGLILHPSEIPENILAVKHAPGEFVVRFFGQYDHYWVNRGRVFPFQEGDTGRVSSRNSKIDAAFSMAVEHAHRAYSILKNESPSNEGDDDIASSLLPPHFVKLKVNKPCGSLINKKIDIEESSLTQCECDPNVEDPCGLYSHCLNRMLLTECGPICRAGERCCNRAFEKRQYPRMEPYRTPARGWGLRTLEDIRAGQFVIEYVGELIDEAEFQRRMKWKHQVRDENYYFLTLDKERMIDAGPKGNLARFMNHSCDPNCETQKWTVLGDVRVGLFALCDIPAKSELTFNYNLECAGIEKKRCLCGAGRCSGFMGAKPKEEPKKNKVKRTYKKRKRIELSPTNELPKPKRRQPKNRELTEIEKDLLIIKNATNGISSDSESSGRHTSVDSVKRKRSENGSPSTKRVKIDKKKLDKLDQTLVTPQSKRTDVNHKSFDVD
ncbi:histone-lysine N-methyltransferase, H3 lysine-36 specific [Pieris rapae]|uniref:histone-lysine N-methyltransferase, H3 lysine-36 specific n=1 Tax=Pieris rapae TaxID=64459 RepID=UPI001E27C428|nr:histone-lysine N-methyltransferase, H3 lysine-36 specific [Pieris rapae]